MASLPEFPGFRVLAEIGRGGAGVVYRARRSLDPQSEVAIKVLHPDSGLDGKLLQRFAREGRVGREIRHENLLPILEVGESDGRPFLVMPLVEGSTLAERIRSRREHARQDPTARREQLREDLRILACVSRALHHAHAAGVVHRDVKPANILVRHDGHPFLIDFGLVRQLSAGSSLTSTGVVIGTPWYMAPEVLCGDTARVGPPADVYALGATLFEIATGRPPFTATTYEELRRRVVEDEPPELDGLDPAQARALAPIVFRALEKEPRHRHDSADRFAAELAGAIDGVRPAVPAAGVRWRRSLRALTRRRVTISMIVIAAALSVAVRLGCQARATREAAIALERLNLFQVAEIALERGELREALVSIQRAVELKPSDPEGHLRRAHAYAEFERMHEAELNIEIARSHGFDPDSASPTDARALYSRALVRLCRRDIAGARDDLRAAVALDSHLNSARFALFQVERRLGNDEAAERSLLAYQANSKRISPTYEVLEAELVELRGDIESAARRLEEYRGRGVDGGDRDLNYRIHCALGRMYCRLERYADSERELRAALRINANDAGSAAILAMVMLIEGDPASAHAIALDALAIDDSLLLGFEVLARVAADREDFEEALRWLRAAPKHGMGAGSLRNVEGWIFFEMGCRFEEKRELELADQMFTECIRIDPQQIGALIYLGQNALGRGEFASALDSFRAARVAWFAAADHANSPYAAWRAVFAGRSNLQIIEVGAHAAACALGDVDEAAQTSSFLLAELGGAGIEDPVVSLLVAQAAATASLECCRDCRLVEKLLGEPAVRELLDSDDEARRIADEAEAACADR